MLGRGIATSPFAQFDALLSPELKRVMQGDIITGNLECLLGEKGNPNPNSHSHFRGDTGRATPLLQRFDVLSLANNHINDFGSEAISETQSYLNEIGVAHVGVGLDEEEAVKPALLERGGHRVAIFAATTVSPLPASGPYKAAAPNEFLFRKIREQKEKGAICILHLHTGGGDFSNPAPFVRELMQEVAQTGVDIVLGHHPHIVQGRQSIAQSQIFYSLGDFIFDKFENGRDSSLVVQADFNPAGEVRQIQAVPVIRTDTLVVEPIGGKELDKFNARLRGLDEMIADGSSDGAFQKEFGNPVKRILEGIVKDARAGGLPALWAKVKRIDRRRLSLIFGPFIGVFRPGKGRQP